jgi:amino acid permease
MRSYSNKDISKNIIYDEKEIEVNNYYILKYKSESHILKSIIFFCGLSLIGCFFFLKGFIGEALYIIYLGFIITFGMVYIIYIMYDLKYRDNQQFNEYDYGYMQKTGTDIKPIQKEKTDDEELNSDKKNKCI